MKTTADIPTMIEQMKEIRDRVSDDTMNMSPAGEAAYLYEQLQWLKSRIKKLSNSRESIQKDKPHVDIHPLVKINHMNTLQAIDYQDLIRELTWLREVIERRFQFSFEKTYADPRTHEVKDYEDITAILPPGKSAATSGYAFFIRQNRLSFSERFLLALALAPHIAPQLLEDLLGNRKTPGGRPLVELGGVRGTVFRGFLPTGTTYLFLMAGYNTDKRLRIMEELSRDSHILLKENVVSIAPASRGEPVFSGVLTMNKAYVQLLTGSAGPTD